MYLRDRIIHVDGHIIGYQFNRKSLGSRRFTRRVRVSSEESQTGEAQVLGRKVRVRRICPESKFHWEVF
jgi:hypothetical protein